MRRFEAGKTYKLYLDNGATIAYKIIARTEKTVQVAIHPDSKYEKIKKVRINNNGVCESVKLGDYLYGDADDDIREEA